MMLWKWVEMNVCGQRSALDSQNFRQAHSSAAPSVYRAIHAVTHRWTDILRPPTRGKVVGLLRIEYKGPGILPPKKYRNYQNLCILAGWYSVSVVSQYFYSQQFYLTSKVIIIICTVLSVEIWELYLQGVTPNFLISSRQIP